MARVTAPADLSEWLSTHPAQAASEAAQGASEAQARVIAFPRRPPVPLGPGLGDGLLFEAALPTIPTPLLEMMGLEVSDSRARIGAATATGLRWALGSSPSWHLALVRAGAPVPRGLFRQPLPVRWLASGLEVDRAARDRCLRVVVTAGRERYSL